MCWRVGATPNDAGLAIASPVVEPESESLVHAVNRTEPRPDSLAVVSPVVELESESLDSPCPASINGTVRPLHTMLCVPEPSTTTL